MDALYHKCWILQSCAPVFRINIRQEVQTGKNDNNKILLLSTVGTSRTHNLMKKIVMNNTVSIFGLQNTLQIYRVPFMFTLVHLSHRFELCVKLSCYSISQLSSQLNTWPKRA
ncbi:unnamed protein product [Albugo candida]|uniref:Uncharacterized protein n=1 Tax=Albugo candida TaxID=65357 RepID=A0A024GMS2_9STRA|nr:unnamed protein product [Albugo candida]|eukprot:CCI47644.1 unnamed protein product [Albugo candida]